MGTWGFGVFDNDINLDFKYDVEKRVNKGMSVRKACDYVSRLENYIYENQDELTLATSCIFKKYHIKLTNFELMQLKVSIFRLLKRAKGYEEESKLREDCLLDVAKEFNINFKIKKQR